MKADGILAPAIAFVCLAAVAVTETYAAAGDLYFSSFTSSKLFRKSPGSEPVEFGGTVSAPGGMAFDRLGNLFVTSGNRILKIGPDGMPAIFASNLNGPQSLAVDSAGNLFSTDLNGNVVYKFTPDGSRSTFASNFNGPSGLAFSGSGDLFVSEVRAGRISKFAPNGTKTPFASGLDLPTGLAVDRFGNLYVAEFGQHRVIKFAPDGSPLPVGFGGFDRPFVLLFDPAANLLIADNAAGLIDSAAPDEVVTIVTETPAPSGLAIEPPRGLPVNISTRLPVLDGDNVLIAGFILVGTDPKKLIIRGIGPSLVAAGISGPLDDPVLELHDSAGAVIAQNDDWKANEAEVAATGIPPSDDREASIVRSLAPGTYTAVERGKGGHTGVAVVEVYDLEQGSQSSLANISTRGFVDVGNNVMICGFIVGSGNGARVLVRGLGPSLAAVGVVGVLPDPKLELRDQNGALVRANDSWKSTQRFEIEAAGLAPTDDAESALVATLPTGNYTAILAGTSGKTGIGLVELYNLR